MTSAAPGRSAWAVRIGVEHHETAEPPSEPCTDLLAMLRLLREG